MDKCFFCGGNLKPSMTDYSTDLNCNITIKDVPCLRCDNCGEIAYTAEVAEKLETLLSGLRKKISEVSTVSFVT